MIWNNLKIAYRNIIRHRSNSTINIVGLTFGIAIFFMIMMFIRHELSYDKNLSNYDRIYKLSMGNASNHSGFIAPLLKENFPEIENTFRFYMFTHNNPLISYKNKHIKIDHCAHVDSTFLSIFSFPVLSGNKKDPLTDLNTIVLTESIANTIFGTENPIGKTITIDNSRGLKVTAILKDLPNNTTFEFNALVSMETFKTLRSGMNELGNPWFNTYVLLAEGVDVLKLQDKIDTFLTDYLKSSFNYELTEKFYLHSLQEVYFNTILYYDHSKHGNYYFVQVFFLIGIVVLIIAIINFLNLSSAKSSLRAKEIGVRKVLGSLRSKLIQQFLLESTILSLISTFFALIIIELLKPIIIDVIGVQIDIGYTDNPIVIIYILLFSLILGVVLGFFPALILSSFKITHLFKNLSIGGKGSKIFRSILIVFQFSISMILMICTIVISQQIHYLKNKDLGYSKENVVLVKMGRSTNGSCEDFRQELLKNPNIATISFSKYIAGNTIFDYLEREMDKEPIAFYTNYVDDEYLNLLEVDLIEGRNFSRDILSDRNYHAVILNETAVIKNKIDNPVGKTFHLFDNERKAKIVGIMKDFHFKSLHQDIESFALIFNSSEYGIDFANIKFSRTITNEMIKDIEDSWTKFYPEIPFEYQEMETFYSSLYDTETRLMQTLIYFTFFAILIACLGLYGLVSFITERRSKEIGIRKIHGASILTIILLVSKDVSKWIAIAFIIACPIGFLFAEKWLGNFAFQIQISWWIYAITGILGLLIGLLTLSFEAYKAAVKNPIDSIRYE